ncbi:hypothetical protein PanWU01x14_040710 [Parasponia andersonii]|uniref:Uncharacterized protein n=1 Tax=Parasponia andersonii TaxID=3476 RepID=A0A2P5DQ89_PARAD|nr:hypothetical protein PanWU01x14_040710 [Parasponia andersonii]
MPGDSVNGVERGGTGADPLAKRIRDGESDRGGGDAAHSLGTIELPLVELGLLGARGCEHDGVPGGNPRRMPHRKPQMVPRFPEDRFEIGLLFGSRESGLSLGFHDSLLFSVTFPRKCTESHRVRGSCLSRIK